MTINTVSYNLKWTWNTMQQNSTCKIFCTAGIFLHFCRTWKLLFWIIIGSSSVSCSTLNIHISKYIHCVHTNAYSNNRVTQFVANLRCGQEWHRNKLLHVRALKCWRIVYRLWILLYIGSVVLSGCIQVCLLCRESFIGLACENCWTYCENRSASVECNSDWEITSTTQPKVTSKHIKKYCALKTRKSFLLCVMSNEP